MPSTLSPVQFFAGRGISAEALERCGVREDHGADGKGVYCPSTGELEIPIAFGYWCVMMLVRC